MYFHEVVFSYPTKGLHFLVAVGFRPILPKVVIKSLDIFCIRAFIGNIHLLLT